MILITSAAYVSPGLVSEFGKLPPCMLPVQNRRLYEHQLRLFASWQAGALVLSLPDGYVLPPFDARYLTESGVRLVYVPRHLSLGQSVVYVLNVCGCYNEPLYLLHGDTLFGSLPECPDTCAVAQAEDDYNWAQPTDEHHGDIYAGFFSFSEPSLLIRKITECGSDFIAGVRAYDAERPLHKQVMPDWLDFGLVNSYYRSISKLTTQRVFNDLKISRYSIRKSSADADKILAEAAWIASAPKSMRRYVPTLWDSGQEGGRGYYEIEYYYLSSLAHLFVFGKNPEFVWRQILQACAEYLEAEYNEKAPEPETVCADSQALYGEKTAVRLAEYCRKAAVDPHHAWKINGVEVPPLDTILTETDAMISKQDTRFATMMHGDFCFSNILYDFKSMLIRVIDPRGLNARRERTIYGDFRYDVAKLGHSILGMYDFIIAGRYDYAENEPYDILLSFHTDSLLQSVQAHFRNSRFAGFDSRELSVYPIMIQLFLSMLPLHHDYPERQKVMLANALRLYSELKHAIL